MQNHCASKFESTSNRATHLSIEMLVITKPGHHNATSLEDHGITNLVDHKHHYITNVAVRV